MGKGNISILTPKDKRKLLKSGEKYRLGLITERTWGNAGTFCDMNDITVLSIALL